MSQKSKSVVKLPTDFSEFHRQEVARRMREEQENNIEPREGPRQEPSKPRELSPEEVALWKLLGDDDEDTAEGQDVVEEEKPLDVEETKKLCRDYITKRIEILIDGSEDYLNRAEIESLPAYDRMRVEFTRSYAWSSQQLDPRVLHFLRRRMEDCPYPETVIGYQTLLEMYTSVLGPDFYFLSLCQSDHHFSKYERWALFGY